MHDQKEREKKKKKKKKGLLATNYAKLGVGAAALLPLDFSTLKRNQVEKQKGGGCLTST